jgi:hypothetical protein
MVWYCHERFGHINMEALLKLSGRASTWPTRDKTGGAAVRGVLSWESQGRRSTG